LEGAVASWTPRELRLPVQQKLMRHSDIRTTLQSQEGDNPATGFGSKLQSLLSGLYVDCTAFSTLILKEIWSGSTEF
jgi:hypothetical protein